MISVTVTRLCVSEYNTEPIIEFFIQVHYKGPSIKDVRKNYQFFTPHPLSAFDEPPPHLSR